MEILKKRFVALKKALDTLENSMTLLQECEPKYHLGMRDSTIQRFKYSADLFWKVLKDYLEFTMKIKIEIARPKAIFQQCLAVKLFTEQDFKQACAMTEDRNLTSHTYDEDLAESIASHIPAFYDFMQKIIRSIETGIQS